jgi:hypothetical protein
MVAIPVFYRSTGKVAGLRVRRGWFGRAILEVSYYQTRVCYAWQEPKPGGTSEWRRVDMNDPDEVVAVSQYLKECNKHI